MGEYTDKKINEKPKGIFYTIILILTFIIMAVGATFAWFTAIATGDNVTVESGTLTITYMDGSKVDASKLKPATKEQVVDNQNTCLYNSETTEQICAKYSFTIKNTGTLTAIVSVTVDNLTNTYSSNVINYVLVEGTTISYIDVETPNVFEGMFTMPSGVTLSPAATKTYTLIIWLDENASNLDQDKSLTGTLKITATQTGGSSNNDDNDIEEPVTPPDPENYTIPNSVANPYYEYEVTVTGYYILEVSGAVGGNGGVGYGGYTGGAGGKGGNIKVRSYLEAGDVLHIYTGASGSVASTNGGTGGYNGGLNGGVRTSWYDSESSTTHYSGAGGGGGGQTHINLIRDSQNVTIIAGHGGAGGGGAGGGTAATRGGKGGDGGGGTTGGNGAAPIGSGSAGSNGASSYNTTYVERLSYTNGQNTGAGNAKIIFDSFE